MLQERPDRRDEQPAVQAGQRVGAFGPTGPHAGEVQRRGPPAVVAQTVRDRLLRLRTTICEAPLSQPLEQAISEAYSGGTVAVRSSATAEDLPDASFAGQYDTILHITSLDNSTFPFHQWCAALWTDRAYEYRAQNRINHDQVMMAVIIQKQVQMSTGRRLWDWWLAGYILI